MAWKWGLECKIVFPIFLECLGGIVSKLGLAVEKLFLKMSRFVAHEYFEKNYDFPSIKEVS